uniref:Uncharacterized protein n=1 Tax=Anguilla anguilla TaxID=7936 RepID=A0A0E9VAT7_ANGAN
MHSAYSFWKTHDRKFILIKETDYCTCR